MERTGTDPGNLSSRYTIVLRGTLVAEGRNERHEISENQALAVKKGEWVRYSAPSGARSISPSASRPSPRTWCTGTAINESRNVVIMGIITPPMLMRASRE